MTLFNQEGDTLYEVLLKAAARVPDKTAYRHNGQTLTFAELVDRSSRLGRVLTEHGVKRGDIVCIYLGKGLETIISLYGVLATGAAYVAIDPTAPKERVAKIIRECGARVLITGGSMAKAVPALLEAGLSFDAVIGGPEQLMAPVISWGEVAQVPLLATSHREVSPQDPSMIFFTSGSTGAPKGIVQTHGGALLFPTWGAKQFGLTRDDHIGNVSPLHFAASVFDVYSAPVLGATVTLVPVETIVFPASLVELFATDKITTLLGVPFLFGQMLERGGIENHDLSALRTVISAGEVSSAKKLQDLMEKLPHAQFHHMYASTETLAICGYKMPRQLDLSLSSIPIGRPELPMQILLVDDNGLPTVPGEVGHVMVSSPSVMKGYWNLPQLNERAFETKVIAGAGECLFVRTGDLARELPDGNFMFAGRKDRLVKLRGQRIDLDEIEIELGNHPDIGGSVVFLVTDEQENQSIECAAVLKQGHETTVAALAGHLKKLLPTYSQPSKIHLFADCPRTPSNKIDRKELERWANQGINVLAKR